MTSQTRTRQAPNSLPTFLLKVLFQLRPWRTPHAWVWISSERKCIETSLVMSPEPNSTLAFRFWRFQESVRSDFFHFDRNVQGKPIANQNGDRRCPCKPIPPKFRGCHFTPKIFRLQKQILGVECPKPLFYSVFWGPPLNFGGVKLSPPKFWGMWAGRGINGSRTKLL